MHTHVRVDIQIHTVLFYVCVEMLDANLIPTGTFLLIVDLQ